MKTHAKDDDGLETLLSLNGYRFFDRGYWVKFEACEVAITEHIPHGIRYSLTLHDKNNNRIIGYDNAHNYKPKKHKYRAKIVTWDHVHREDKVRHYEFNSAAQLIEDFWKTVEEYI